MEHTFEEILEVLEKCEDWGDLEEKKKVKLAGIEMQLMRI